MNFLHELLNGFGLFKKWDGNKTVIGLFLAQYGQEISRLIAPIGESLAKNGNDEFAIIGGAITSLASFLAVGGIIDKVIVKPSIEKKK